MRAWSEYHVGWGLPVGRRRRLGGRSLRVWLAGSRAPRMVSWIKVGAIDRPARSTVARLPAQTASAASARAPGDGGYRRACRGSPVEAAGGPAGLGPEVAEDAVGVGELLDGEVVGAVRDRPEDVLVVVVVRDERLDAVQAEERVLELLVHVASRGLLAAVDGEVDEELVVETGEERGRDPLVVAHATIRHAPEGK